jgi:uncharacterized protein
MTATPLLERCGDQKHRAAAAHRVGDMPSLTAGLGLKPQHYGEARDCCAAGLWFEVHPENYMVAGGPRLAWLEALRSTHPLSFHGVAMSLASDEGLDADHLECFAALVRRYDPVLISEHLAWSTWRGNYRPDLLPVPRTAGTLRCLVDNIGRVQDWLQRPIALENPSHYLAFDEHEFGEVEFLTAIAQRSGCRLLLDVNNVYVSARNLGEHPEHAIDSVPAELVAEIHLAGHSADPLLGDRLLIDSHDAPVDAEVWSLYRRLIDRVGPRPTLIERDAHIPTFAELLEERDQADTLLRRQPLAEAA